jgi:predicted RNase H-related nuclease YkuK (DUF458 family)
MRNKLDLEEVRSFLKSQTPETKVYIGCDSKRIKTNGVWYADYVTVIVVHINGNNGCKLFGEVLRERDFDQKQNRPRYRLMNEVFRVSELYLKLADVLNDRYVEVHLDINPSVEYGSNCVIQEAIGYIRGTCNVIPMVKPDAFAASYAADRLKGLKIVKNWY